MKIIIILLAFILSGCSKGDDSGNGNKYYDMRQVYYGEFSEEVNSLNIPLSFSYKSGAYGITFIDSNDIIIINEFEDKSQADEELKRSLNFYYPKLQVDEDKLFKKIYSKENNNLMVSIYSTEGNAEELYEKVFGEGVDNN